MLSYNRVSSSTFLVETQNLIIYFPDFVDQREARSQAYILQHAYDFSCDLTGGEYPFNGRKIEIFFDAALGNISYAGNPIRMGTVSETIARTAISFLRDEC